MVKTRHRLKRNKNLTDRIEGQITQKNLCHFVRKNLKKNLKGSQKKSQKSQNKSQKSQKSQNS